MDDITRPTCMEVSLEDFHHNITEIKKIIDIECTFDVNYQN